MEIKIKPKIIKSEDLKEQDFGSTKVADIINEEGWLFSVAKVKKIGEVNLKHKFPGVNLFRLRKNVKNSHIVIKETLKL